MANDLQALVREAVKAEQQRQKDEDRRLKEAEEQRYQGRRQFLRINLDKALGEDLAALICDEAGGLGIQTDKGRYNLWVDFLYQGQLFRIVPSDTNQWTVYLVEDAVMTKLTDLYPGRDTNNRELLLLGLARGTNEIA